MNLYPMTCEFGYTTVTSEDEPLDGAVQATVLPWHATPDNATTWTDAEWVGSPALKRRFRVMLAGRLAEAPAGAVQPGTPGKHRMWMLLPSTPEQVIKPGGEVIVH